MPVAPLDGNSRAALIAASKNDGTTIVPIKADPITHRLKVNMAHTGADNGNNGGNAMLDDNSRNVLIALSSAGDGSLVEVYGDPAAGTLLVDNL